LKLLALHYRYVSVDANVLLAAARSEQWRPHGHFLRALEMLKGPTIDATSAAGVAATFLRTLFLESLLPHQQRTLTFAVLDALHSGRPTSAVDGAFKAQLGYAFRLVPMALSAALQTIAAWERWRLA
jgi:hypothetical protein